jgi:Reverse transcriptase (RNA-dependent DNA polymerase)
MDREVDTLRQAGTWETVPRPTSKNVVSYSLPDQAQGRRLDRQVQGTRGFTQVHGVDYFATFSPVVKLSSFRAVLAIAARNDWEVDSFDFNGAYLNGELDEDEEIYMQEPPGYEEGEGNVKRLRKSLYGLKQAGRRWYDALSCALADIGFVVTQADPGVFRAETGSDVLILAVHVDDCAITGSSPELIEAYKKKLNERYSLTDLGPIHWLLGIRVIRNHVERTISLSQAAYIDTIVAQFGLTDAKAQPTPMAPTITFSKDDSLANATHAVRMRKVPYREAIGSLMYAAVATRPDIQTTIIGPG